MTPSPFILLGLTGRAGSGKDTAADHLCRHFGFVRASFAEPIKTMLEAMLEHAGVDHAHLYEPSKKNTPIPQLRGATARQMMQTLGTEWGRECMGPHWWLHLLDRHLGISAGTPVHDRIVITDVRFPNEGEWLHQHGGHVLRLVRHHAAPVRAHASEQQIDLLPADFAIHNDGPTLCGLHALLDGLADSLGAEERDPLER